MTWSELEKWAEKNRMGVAAYPTPKGEQPAEAYICLFDTTDYLVMHHKDVGKAKRALCRAVARILESER